VGDGRPFLPKHALTQHLWSRTWLEAEPSKSFEGKTVATTHHGSHSKSVNPRFVEDPVNAAFVSDKTPLLQQADLWVTVTCMIHLTTTSARVGQKTPSTPLTHLLRTAAQRFACSARKRQSSALCTVFAIARQALLTSLSRTGRGDASP
jgi:hypothetical protein